MLGKYPQRLAEDADDHNIDRGRRIPTRPWEAVWTPALQWWGLTPGDVTAALPNKGNFPARLLYDQSDVFSKREKKREEEEKREGEKEESHLLPLYLTPAVPTTAFTTHVEPLWLLAAVTVGAVAAVLAAAPDPTCSKTVTLMLVPPTIIGPDTAASPSGGGGGAIMVERYCRGG